MYFGGPKRSGFRPRSGGFRGPRPRPLDISVPRCKAFDPWPKPIRGPRDPFSPKPPRINKVNLPHIRPTSQPHQYVLPEFKIKSGRRSVGDIHTTFKVDRYSNVYKPHGTIRTRGMKSFGPKPIRFKKF